jgi:hypothetical protein
MCARSALPRATRSLSDETATGTRRRPVWPPAPDQVLCATRAVIRRSGPPLTVAVTRRLASSPRHVQRAFAGVGEMSFSAVLREARDPSCSPSSN